MTDERKKIIVVDDSLEDLTILKSILKDIYMVYPCPSASAMFNLLEHIQPDLILLDIEMPEMNGYDAAKKLKSVDEYYDIPIIFLTAMSDDQSEIKGLKLGAVDYIRKPFIMPLLLKRINIHLSLMEQRKMILDRNKEIEKLLEIKIEEARLREKAELEAEDASRAKSEFLSHMSHEIRSPLNAVIGTINIARETDDIQTLKRYLEKANDTSRHLLKVINNILDMSKIEANKFELLHGNFNFRNMLSKVIDLTRARAEKKNTHITVNVHENFPPFIINDEQRLSQVITNLMTNAIKFSLENGKIELNAEKLEERDGDIILKIEVADNGIGISPERQKELFTIYKHADGIQQKTGGTGLGLAISKRIVELMQGKIWIESEPDKGSKFIFTIKAKEGTRSADMDFTGSEDDFDFTKYSILIAEDVEINREILLAFLEKTGIAIDFVENGKAAVSMYTENPDKYNLILMDVHMPEMDGHEATRAIRVFEEEIKSKTFESDCSSFTKGENKSMEFPKETPKRLSKCPKGIPIIAMTADVFQEDIDKCLSAGMNDHIAKPIITDDLHAKLKKHLLSLEYGGVE
ncbi:response regulator [Treponema sp. R80B11-R83G3]